MTWSRSRIGRACTAEKPACPACGGELGPALVGAQVGARHGLAGPEAVQAGSLVALQLEQLEQPGGLAGGGHHAQFPARVGQQQPGGGDVEQLDAAAGQHVQEVDDVEIGDHGVGKLDKGLRQQLSVHPLTLSTKSARPAARTAAACRRRRRVPHVLSPRGRSGSGNSRRRRATMSRATSAS